MRNVDLHSHSLISDGTLTPAGVAERAKTNGVDLWALTDHDELAGIEPARQAAAAVGLTHIPGVEISITWGGHTVHIVGLQIDETNPQLVQGLETTRSGRKERALEISQQLQQAGIPNALEGALKFAGNPELIGRMHFARYLVDNGYCANVAEVFKNYLIKGKPGYAAHRWATLAQALAWIHAAGGTAIVAHPGRYKFDRIAFHEFFENFKELGGQAIEVVTGSHTVEQYAVYANVARRYGFKVSRGSDFHCPRESRVDLGTLPPCPSGLVPVWKDW